MSRFSVIDLSLEGLKLVKRTHIGDNRGFLSRIFCSAELAEAGWRKPIAQINHTYTAKRGAIRGMHFQVQPFAEMKLVSCIHGEVWDVAVDLRAGSDTFLQWHAELLSKQNGHALLVPEGFAHGFQAITDDVQLLYCHSAPYQSDAEYGLNPQDPAIDIEWPIEISDISDKDRQQLMLDESFNGIIL